MRMKRKISNGATITVKGKPDLHCITPNDQNVDKQLVPATSYNLRTSGVKNVCEENEVLNLSEWIKTTEKQPYGHVYKNPPEETKNLLTR